MAGPQDLSIETGGELGPDLGLGTRPPDQPTAVPKKKPTDIIPDVPVLDSTRENKAISDVGPAPPPDGNDSFDSFLLSVDNQNTTKAADKQFEMLQGLPDSPDAIPPVEPKQMGRGEVIGRTVSDIVYQAPIKGVRDAIQETINLSLELDQQLKKVTAGTPFEFLGRPPGSPPGTELFKPGSPETQLPDPGETKTTVGGIEKNIVQFLTGFAVAGKALEGAGLLQDMPVAANYAKGFISMLTSFDGNQERLGNLIQELDPEHKGGLVTDVATYLRAEDDDPELLGRLKAALEDAGGGVLVEGVIQGVRALRAATRVKEITGAPTFEQAAQKITSEDFVNQLKAENKPVDAIDNMLGSTSAEMVVKPNELPKSTGSPLAQAMEEAHALSTQGKATAGMAPTQYAGQTVNVNFGRIDTPDDLKLAVEQLKAAAPKVGAGVPIQKLSNVLAEAKTPGAKNAWNLIIQERDRRIKTGRSTPMVAEDQEALKSLWVSASNKLDEVIKTARASPTPENLFAFRKMLSTFGVINNELLGVRQATSKAVNIWKKNDKIPVRRMKDITEILERTGGVEDNKKLLDQLGRHIDSSPDAAVAISKMSQASRRYGTTRAIRNFWTLGLLTNWKTHEVNAISNTIMMFAVAAERAGAARYSQALGVEGGVAPGEATAMLTGMWESLGDAMINAGRTFRTGEGGGAFQKIELPFEHNVFEDSDTALKKFVNTSMWYWGGIGRALQAGDEFFKSLNMGAEVNALIKRQVTEEFNNGKLSMKDMASRTAELKNDVPEEILLKAEDMARYATFTKEPGRATKAFARFINEVPGGRYIIPFINTPSNLFNAAIERTPFAPLQKQFRDAVRRGGADESIAMAKLTMGMTLMGKSMQDTFDGKQTGSGPPFWSPEAARWKAEGKQPYSRLINGKWVPYNRFDPMGMVLGLGGDMAEKLQYMDNFDGESLADYENLLAGATFSLASQMTNKSYMQGAASLFDALNSDGFSAQAFVNSFAGSMIPSAVGEVTRLVDPVQRQAYDFVTKWKSRIPGQSSTLEPKLDMWGREQKYGTGNTLIDALNPVNITRSNITPIDHEFDLQGWSIPKDIRGFTTEGADINFRGRPDIANFMLKTSRATKPSEMGDPNDPKVRKLLRKYGDYSMHDLMNMIVTGNHPLYRRYAKKDDGPDGTKVAMMKMIYKDYYEASKELTLRQFPELQIEVFDQEAKRLQKRQDIATERQRNPAGDTP